MDQRPLLDPPTTAARIAAGLAVAVVALVLLVALLRVPIDALNAATFAGGETEQALVVDVVATGEGDERRTESVVETLSGVLLSYRDARPPGTVVDVVTVPFGDRAHPPTGPGPSHGGSVPIAVACVLLSPRLVRAVRGLPPPATVGVRHLAGIETALAHVLAGVVGWAGASVASLSGAGWWAAAVAVAAQLWLAQRCRRARLEIDDGRWTVHPVLRRPFDVDLRSITPGSLQVVEFGPMTSRRLAVCFPPGALDGDADTGRGQSAPPEPPSGWLSRARLPSLQPLRWLGDTDLARRLLEADPTPSGTGVDRLRRLAGPDQPATPPTWPSPG